MLVDSRRHLALLDVPDVSVYPESSEASGYAPTSSAEAPAWYAKDSTPYATEAPRESSAMTFEPRSVQERAPASAPSGNFLSTLLGSGLELVKGLLGGKPAAPAPAVMQPTAPPPSSAGIPDWVYIAAPLALGAVVLALVLKSNPPSAPLPMAGYSRRRKKR